MQRPAGPVDTAVTPRLESSPGPGEQLPGRDPVDIFLAGSAKHLGIPNYRRMLKRAGIEIDDENLPGATQSIMRENAFLFGDRDEINAGVDLFLEAGVDEIVLNLTGTAIEYGRARAVQDLHMLLDL